MERETKEVTLPSGKIAVIKTYQTAGERNQLRKAYMSCAQVEMVGGIAEVGKVNPEMLDLVNTKMLEVMVVKYDGSADNIISRIEDGTPADYDALIDSLQPETLAQAK